MVNRACAPVEVGELPRPSESHSASKAGVLGPGGTSAHMSEAGSQERVNRAPFDVWHAFICGCRPLPEYTSARMQLHAETPVGLAEGKGAPPLALVSSVSGLLLALEQLVVQRET